MQPQQFHTVLRTHIDSVLIVLGFVLSLVIPATVHRQHHFLADPASLAYYASHSQVTMVLLAGFHVLGLAAIIVGVLGLRGAYPSTNERFLAIIRFALALCALAVGLLILTTSLFSVFQLLDYFILRAAAAALGLFIAVGLTQRFFSFPTDQLYLGAAIFGGCFGFFLTPLFLFLLLLSIAAYLISPRIRQFAGAWANYLMPPSSTAAPPGSTTPTNPAAGQIAQLQQRKAWLQQQNRVPPQFIKEELARLDRDIRALGGTP